MSLSFIVIFACAHATFAKPRASNSPFPHFSMDDSASARKRGSSLTSWYDKSRKGQS